MGLSQANILILPFTAAITLPHRAGLLLPTAPAGSQFSWSWLHSITGDSCLLKGMSRNQTRRKKSLRATGRSPFGFSLPWLAGKALPRRPAQQHWGPGRCRERRVNTLFHSISGSRLEELHTQAAQTGAGSPWQLFPAPSGAPAAPGPLSPRCRPAGPGLLRPPHRAPLMSHHRSCSPLIRLMSN